MARSATFSTKRIATRFYAAIGFTCLITIITIIVALISFERISLSQQIVFESTLPESEVVVAVARTSGAIVTAVPRLTAASSPEELAEVTGNLAELRHDFEDDLAGLLAINESEFSEFSAKGQQLLGNVADIEASMELLFLLRGRGEVFRDRLSQLELEMRQTLVPMIDDQYFFTVTGRREIGKPPVPFDDHFTETQFRLYRYLSSIEKEAILAIQVLATIGVTDDIALLGVLNEQFNSSRDRLSTYIGALQDRDMARTVNPILIELLALGFGDLNEFNGFSIRESELRLLADQRSLAAEGRRLSDELVGDAEQLVQDVNLRAQMQAAAAGQVLETARLVLIALGVMGIFCALAIVWLLVARVLLTRLRYLSERMRQMARGDLSEEVISTGQDEIADMANALEVFRQRALEAQRLNLVEELANELQERNVAMQQVVDELKTAQNQIVMREKLAALGELTAGVAHEIKNPLNFVKNFTESSRELVEELSEVIADEEMSEEERKEEIGSIGEMLTGNFDRILEHGNRAVRIVNDMLRMGRDAGTAQSTDINQLVDQHAKLAYHGARASIEDFRVKLNVDLDPDVGEAIVVSQEIGRVILNMVGNSCYAVHQKRLTLQAGAGEGNPVDYVPELRVTTAKSGNMIEITIRDNGTGMPESLIEKIFNPFFTTKPTDEGTGLGLAMSSDIVQKHGGSIAVETSEGEFTEMKVELPADATIALDEAENDENSSS